MQRIATACLLAAALGGLCASAAGKIKEEKYSSALHLRNGIKIDTVSHPQWHEVPHPSGRFQGLSVQERMDSDTLHSFIVQVRSVLDADIHRIIPELESQQHMVGYLMNGAYLVRATHQTAAKLQRLGFVNWVGVIPPEAKLGPGLVENPDWQAWRDNVRGGHFRGDMEDHSENGTEVGPFVPKKDFPPNKPVSKDGPNKVLNVRLHNEFENMQQIEDYSANLALLWTTEKGTSIEVVPKTLHSLDVQSSAKDVDLHELALWLAEHSEVESVSLKRTFKSTNKWARGVVQNDNQAALDYTAQTGIISWDYDLDGTGQIVGVADSGIDYRSCYFADTVSSAPAQPPYKTWKAYGAVSKSDMTSTSDLSRRKIVQYVHSVSDGSCLSDKMDENANLGGHGTHVSGSVAGYPADASTATLRQHSGMATGAKIAFFDIGDAAGEGNLCLPDDLNENMFPWAYATGARIHTNSWGYSWDGTAANDFRGEYFQESQEIDLFMYNNKDFLILFAAGNDGDCFDLNSVSPPATNKNGLSVGATMSNPLATGYGSADLNTIASFSARGPTNDLRLKPEVFTPGYYITSMQNSQTAGATCLAANVNSMLANLAGTSMATPVMAGHVALIRQYFADGFYPSGKATPSNAFTPSGSLLKNIVINSAKDFSKGCSVCGLGTFTLNTSASVRPWVEQGFGRPVLGNTLYFEGDTRNLHIPSLTLGNEEVYFDKAISTGVWQNYSYCIRPNTVQTVAVTLVWTDYPGSPLVEKQLVNDLDLTVTTSTTTYVGNLGSSIYLSRVLTALDNANLLSTYGYKSTSDLVDRINNYEAVYVPGASVDTDITVSVYGYRVPSGPQPYSLVISGVVSEGKCSASSQASQPKEWTTSAQIITKDATVSSVPQVVPLSLLNQDAASSAVNVSPSFTLVLISALLSIVFFL